MRKIIFVAMLFCASAACLLVGGISLFQNVDYRLHSRRATMELADQGKKITIPTGGYDVHLVDVRYVSPEGNLVVIGKRLSGDMARQIASGAKVTVVYLTNNPQHADFSEREAPSAWAWLALGAALFATFFYSLKMVRRESQ